MFTGIIEELGVIQEIKKGVKSSKLLIKSNKVLENTKIGDSICTNGVCLTVTDLKINSFEADVMAETLRRSNLGDLQVGSKVNLERALTLKSRLGGHIVSGHIDGTGEILSLMKEDNSTWVTIRTTSDSITIDGISLTVSYVDKSVFKVSIIPHTAQKTTLLTKNNGDTVNLECDMISKYVEKIMELSKKEENKKNTLLTEDFLRENGFF